MPPRAPTRSKVALVTPLGTVQDCSAAVWEKPRQMRPAETAVIVEASALVQVTLTRNAFGDVV